MNGTELSGLLERADRNPAWLAKQVGRSRTQVVRWIQDGVPAEFEQTVRGLLPAIEKAA